MWTSMWYTSIWAILMADMRTGALQNKETRDVLQEQETQVLALISFTSFLECVRKEQTENGFSVNKDLAAQRCYQCSNVNTTCNQQNASISCTAENPYCGTTAASPHYDSSLSCLPSSKNQCLIEFNTKSTLKLSCICSGDYCNAPFSMKVQNKLHLFANINTLNKSSDLMEAFLKYMNIDNVTDLYKTLTDETEETNIATAPYDSTLSPFLKITDIPLPGNQTTDVEEPHAEALKHEATVPPDDDEDESEGSGAYDDTKTPKNPASAPAVPSAYLPAEENKASQELNFSFTLIGIIMIATLQICT